MHEVNGFSVDYRPTDGDIHVPVPRFCHDMRCHGIKGQTTERPRKLRRRALGNDSMNLIMNYAKA